MKSSPSIRSLVMVASIAVASLAVPAAAETNAAGSPAAATDRNFTFATALTPTLSAGTYAGTLNLHISAGGIVTGFYRPDDGGLREVEGGLDGDKLWLEIGRALHLTGTFDGREIVASTFEYGQTYTFTGKSGR